MRTVRSDELDTMDDTRLRDHDADGDVWDSHGQRRPELRKHKTVRTIEQLVASHQARENRAPNQTVDPESGATSSPSKAFQLLRDYEMATSILESRNRADIGPRRPRVAFVQPRSRIETKFRTAPGGSKLTLDAVDEDDVDGRRRVLRSASSASTAHLSKDSTYTSTSSSGNNDDSSRGFDSSNSNSGSGSKKKKSVKFQDDSPPTSRRQQQHHMDQSRCDDDASEGGKGHVDSPIHAACYKGDAVAVSHLLGHYSAHDATKLVNAACTCGMTPLQVACDQGHTKVAKLLLRRQARVGKRDNASSSPVTGPPAGLMSAGLGKKRHRSCIALACARRSVELVELLLDSGARVDEDALVTACSVGDVAMVKVLMLSSSSQKKTSSSSTTKSLTSGFEKLWKPSGSGSGSSGSGVRDSGSGDLDPLWISNAAAIAVVNEQLHILPALLGDGQSSSSRQRVTSCALDAAGTADYKLLRCLAKRFDAQLFVEARDAHNNSLLHVAVKQASAKCVVLLIRLGLDVDARDALGITPLYMACARGQAAIVQLLVNAGAQCGRMGPNDETPLHLAAQENHLRCVQLLLVDSRAQVDARTLDQCTALHLACQRGNTAVAKCLLDHGADINAKTVGDETPLLKASRMSNMETVKLLLARDAEIATSSTSSIESEGHSGSRGRDSSAMALTASTATSSVFSTGHSNSTGRRSVVASQSAAAAEQDDIFIAKSNTHTSFKGWLKSVVKNK